MELMADINTHIVNEDYELDGQAPQATLTGVTLEISSLLASRLSLVSMGQVV
jgi:hypothetical protein